MKFAKELESELVPEWKAKYLDYKGGKKKLQAVSRAIRQANRTPRFRRGASPSPFADVSSYFSRQPTDPIPNSTSDARNNVGKGKKNGTNRYKAPVETDPLFADEDRVDAKRKLTSSYTRYGSIWGSPPREPVASLDRPPSLLLPGPAISSGASNRIARDDDPGESAYEAGRTRSPLPDQKFGFRKQSLFIPSLAAGRFKRFFSVAGGVPSPGSADFPMDAYREIETAQQDFFQFLDSELDKIEAFYKEKEDEATERLRILRDQLHILRDRRLDDLVRTESLNGVEQDGNHRDSKHSLFGAVNHAVDAALHGKVGKRTQFMKTMTTPHALRGQDDRRDYVRRATDANVPYRIAKRKLKLAMQEFYRGLELLKSYALLNRTAFRKMNKKYDKAANARPTGRYMSEKVSKAWFVKSDVLDGHIQAVEDLYARYFEAGSHKVAANKLRTKSTKKEYHGGAMFRNGIFLSAGVIFGAQGLINAVRLLYDREMGNDTSYLLQLYAGYLMMVLLAHFFCLACEFWTRSKVNYVFIFELDTRHHLDWRQLLELPCLFTFLLGFFFWLNFSQYGASSMFIYYPVILTAVSGLILFCPLPILYIKTRTWFLYTIWRLFFSGFYPVEFRDFFIGDMFCSLAYSLGNIELFFCLYAHHWENAPQCNSTHSRLLGFFTALPGIWRALQCIRRYYDTRNVFPHLVNCGKYTWTILYYMSLSLYRMNQTPALKAFFIFAAAVNATYCSVWDLVMDWSLLDATAPKPFLRDTLAYRQYWMYYLAIFVDPILRFTWIFYAAYAPADQHSSIISFVVGILEIIRRGYWVIFRVENEHCTNVGRFRASRNMPLPFATADYEPAALESRVGTEPTPGQLQTPSIAAGTPQMAGERISPATTSSMRMHPSPSSLRLRKHSPLVQGLTRVGSIMHNAHAQDFERRRKDFEEPLAAEGSSDEDDEGHGDADASKRQSNDNITEQSELEEARDALEIGTGQSNFTE